MPTLRHASLLVLVLILSGCGLFGIGEGPPYDLAGSWDGSVRIEGDVIQGTLTLAQERRALDARFEAPALGLVARGIGLVTDEGDVQIELDYNLDCPGVATLEGRVEPQDPTAGDARRVTGSVEAEDCTGTIRGRFTFERGDGSGGG